VLAGVKPNTHERVSWHVGRASGRMLKDNTQLKRSSMSSTIRYCGLIGNFRDARVAESALALLPHLRARGVETLIAAQAPFDALAAGATVVAESELAARVDLMLAIGGDGTLLYAARLVADRGVPLLGINRGRLGFLTDVMPLEMLSCVDAALEGRCALDQRPLLVASLRAADGRVAQLFALNDVVLQKYETGRMLDFETWIDQRYVNTHGGDGLVVSSATGSTAYALSCGGPIVEPQLDVLVVVPICPHTLSDRPIVVSGRSTIEVQLVDRPDTRAQVTCDGAPLGDLLPGDKLEIRPTPRRITLLHPPGYDYFRLLRSKLHWGRGADHDR
jgi:NAD+ kinase